MARTSAIRNDQLLVKCEICDWTWHPLVQACIVCKGQRCTRCYPAAEVLRLCEHCDQWHCNHCVDVIAICDTKNGVQLKDKCSVCEDFLGEDDHLECEGCQELFHYDCFLGAICIECEDGFCGECQQSMSKCPHCPGTRCDACTFSHHHAHPRKLVA